MVPRTKNRDFHEYLQFAAQISQEAGKIVMQAVGKELFIEYKEGNKKNLVTKIDQQVENFLIRKIQKKYSDHALLTEETGQHGDTKKEFQWIIDPIDGTTNFSHGYPFFAISIGLKKGESTFAGAIYAPALKEMYTAEKGKGAFLNGKKIHVSKIPKVEKALIATGFGSTNNLANMPNFIHFVSKAQAVRRAGAAALDLCHVAAGKLDGFWEFGLKAWDIAAGSLIVEEAGGKITDTEGKNLNFEKGNIVASNGHIHNEMLQLLKEK